uniref:Uncharacterized protein n=1 Tax=Setaria viridis TaxID=4556 RepID=A0A4U6TFW4_SETVI|nr:hypothetical protein SEVIR_8G061500v2 [Setaria viridis]
MLQMLRQNTMTLMEDAEPIQKLFRKFINHLSPELALVLTPAAFIESNYIQVQSAKKCIAGTQINQQAKTQLEVNRLKAKEIKQFNELVASSSNAEQSLKGMETKQDRLLQELN